MQLFYYQAVLRQVVGLVVAIASLNLPVNLLKMPTRQFILLSTALLCLLKKNPKVNVVIQGYCDKRGTAEYNLALGERRADAVKQYLVSQGICASRIATVSYGKEYAFPGDTEEAYAKSRRGVTVVELSK